MKKILVVPQISSKSVGGHVLLQKDSGFNLLVNMFKHLTDELDIHWVFPFDLVDSDIENMEQLTALLNVKEENISIIAHTFTNAKAERMNFQINFWDWFKKKRVSSFDYVFVAEPTHVLNYKEVFPDAKIITYNSWLAFKTMPNIHLRQFEGMCAADLTLVNSNYTISQILDFYKEYPDVLKLNIRKLEPSFDSKLKQNCQLKTMKNNKMGIIYNHRLSEDPYYATAFKYLVEVMKGLESVIGTNNMPDVYLTNPSGKSTEMLKQLPYYFKAVEFATQNEYNEFLRSKQVFVHLNTFFDSEGMWSMSTVEAAVNGNICLLPKKYGYAEIFEPTYHGYCDDVSEMINKLIVIYGCAKDDGFDKNVYSTRKVLQYDGIAMAYKLYGMINELLSEGKLVHKPWGSFEVLSHEHNRWVKYLHIKKGSSLSLQKHKYRDEHWIVVEGECVAVVGDEELTMKAGECCYIKKDKVHSIHAQTDVTILEYASGELVHEADIERLADKYGRN